MQERPGFRFVPPLLQRPWVSGHQGARGSAHGPRLARAVRQRGVPADVRPDGPEQNYLEPNEVAVRHGICGDPEQVHVVRRWWWWVAFAVPRGTAVRILVVCDGAANISGPHHTVKKTISGEM